jgi:hypothetical protein
MTPSGIETVQCLNQLRYRVPPPWTERDSNLKCNFSHGLLHCHMYSVYCTETFVPTHKVKQSSNSETCNINSTNHRLSKRLKSCILTTMFFRVSSCSYLSIVSSVIRLYLPSYVTPRYRSRNKTIETARVEFKNQGIRIIQSNTSFIVKYTYI